MRLPIVVVASFLAAHASADIIEVPADEPTVQGAINAADTGDEIIVSPGTYVEHLDFNGKDIILRSTDPTNAAIVAATVLDAGGTGRVAIFDAGEGPTTTLSGFTITGGNTSEGGGTCCIAASPTISYCVFVGNEAFQGAGMYNLLSDSAVIECRFEGNIAQDRGGGFLQVNGSPTIQGCTFVQNFAGEGGGLHNDDNTAMITDCYFTENIATVGGGIYNDSGNPTIMGTTVCNNAPNQIQGAYTDGGGNEVAARCPAGCDEDLTGDGVIDINDLLAVLGGWDTPGGDVTGDGQTDVNDLLAVIGVFGQDC